MNSSIHFPVRLNDSLGSCGYKPNPTWLDTKVGETPDKFCLTNVGGEAWSLAYTTHIFILEFTQRIHGTGIFA